MSTFLPSPHFNLTEFEPTLVSSSTGGYGGRALVVTLIGALNAPTPTAFTACTRTLQPTRSNVNTYLWFTAKATTKNFTFVFKDNKVQRRRTISQPTMYLYSTPPNSFFSFTNYGDQRWHCTLSSDNSSPICSTSAVPTNRRNIHHRPAPL